MITLICGPMFARKSEKEREIVERYIYRRRHVYLFRPELDTRPEVSTHGGAVLRSGKYLTISRVMRGELLYPKAPDGTSLVVFTEAQFFGDDLIHWVNEHDRRGVDVLVTCLDRDSKGEPFGPIKELLFVADRVRKQTAVCVRCGRNATRSQRIVDVDDQILIGAAEAYEARCARCHRP